MVRKRYTEEQIIAVLNEAEAGARTVDLFRKHGMSDATRGCVSCLGKGSDLAVPGCTSCSRGRDWWSTTSGASVSTGRRDLAYGERGVVRAQQEPG